MKDYGPARTAPDPVVPTQTRVYFWKYMPPVVTAGSVVVALLQNGNVVAYAGPFLGAWGVIALARLLWQGAKALGADSWEIVE